MFRLIHLPFFALLLAGLAASGVSAQESAIIEALSSGEIEGTSLLALPPAEAAPPPGFADDDDEVYGITRQTERDIVDRAFPLVAVKWPFNSVFVCWEEDDPQFTAQRALVRQAIKDSWEAHSALHVNAEWPKCNEEATGIRIHIEDVGPHVKLLGKLLEEQRVRNGMVLNFTYNNWGQTCRTKMDFCNRAIAVHEFGHAIGFAHEQNRPDTPGECNEIHDPQGPDGDTLLTPWDQHSVMNYCNEKYSNNGELSAFDIEAVQYIYGKPL